MAYPPNIDAIDAAFKVRGKPGVIFSWTDEGGDIIFNPSDLPVSTELIAHEATHCSRHRWIGNGSENWWRRYIEDVAFRLDEETLAHRAEYQRFCQRRAAPNDRAKYLITIAERMSGPVYSHMVSFDDACRLIREKT